jgi:hypothetical protein
MAAQTLRSANNGNAAVAQALLGHKSITTTEIYLGLTDEERLREAMERRDAYLAEQRERVALVGADRLPKPAPCSPTRKLAKGGGR